MENPNMMADMMKKNVTGMLPQVLLLLLLLRLSPPLSRPLCPVAVIVFDGVFGPPQSSS